MAGSADSVVAGVAHLAQLTLLLVLEFGLLATQFAFCAGNLHALAGARPDHVGFRFSLGCEAVGNLASIGYRAGQLIELGNDQCVTMTSYDNPTFNENYIVPF